MFLNVSRMKGCLITVDSRWAIQSASNKVCSPGVRLLVMKASDRAAVHGTKLPIPHIEDVSASFEGCGDGHPKSKEDREKKRKEIEDIIDSQLKNKNWELLSDSSIN